MCEFEEKTFRVGIDTATTGCVAITCGDEIIDIIKYPDREYDKGSEKVIDAKIKYLETQEKSKTKIKALKAEKKALKRRAIRNYKAIYDFLFQYKDDIREVIIEEPIRQVSGMATSIDAIFANAQTLGVYTTICSILELPYKLYSPTQWHKLFDYQLTTKTQKEKREEIKIQSIQFCKDYFKNAEDFLIRKGCKKEDDNIAEAILLSLVGERECSEIC